MYVQTVSRTSLIPQSYKASKLSTVLQDTQFASQAAHRRMHRTINTIDCSHASCVAPTRRAASIWSKDYGAHDYKCCSMVHTDNTLFRCRDAFGNLRVDEMDADVAPSDHFSVVLEAISYDYDEDGSTTLGGVYGATGSGGTVVTGKLEFDAENGVFLVEYVPFVAGTHLLNVTFQVNCEVKDFSFYFFPRFGSKPEWLISLTHQTRLTFFSRDCSSCLPQCPHRRELPNARACLVIDR